MPYEVALTANARRQYDAADRPLKLKLDRCFTQLAVEPYQHPRITRLKGGGSLPELRYRIGDKYRVVYEVAEQIRVVEVIDIENRNAVYKKRRRR